MHDIDPIETKEWLDAVDSILNEDGVVRAQYIIEKLTFHAQNKGVAIKLSFSTPYNNTIHPENELDFPGDIPVEKKVHSIIRWNALAMVMKANIEDSSLGGHISTFASSATLYDVGFNHFFVADNGDKLGDLIYFQGHASPGIYARAFIEGRLSEKQLNNFRRETAGEGLSSYPHPWLMPDFWQFPTVSMGLGPLQAIYQARYIKYLINRSMIPDQNRKVWAFLGDGEMDEPESLGAITLAGRENLDNLIFVINCNLQRLDGPVRGNGKIIQELESVFLGAGWNVIKVVWGSRWDKLLKKDTSGMLQKLMNEAIDGDYQNCKAKGGAWVRENFFGRYPETLKLVESMTDEEIFHLNRGGHDPQKVYSSYHMAINHKNQPTVILVKTVKGYGIGTTGESSNISHNVKKIPLEDLKTFRDRFNLPLTDRQVEELAYYKPNSNSDEIRYLEKQRKKLGGYIPSRRRQSDLKLNIPDLSVFDSILKGSGDREISTTMVYVRILSILAKDKNIGKYIVPIIPDEARTFGMEGMFRQLGIYSSKGQNYDPVDAGQVMFYKESKKGQILEEGINEGGAHASWIAAATSYSHHNIPTIPFYAFYSMFGFQRTGDLAWASGDIRAKGFLIGATSGRTSLNGEGLQHQDGHSHLIASTVPNCVSYDPSYGYELAIIIQDGLRRMYQENENVWYYITTMNENYKMPEIPKEKSVKEGVLKGLYCLENTKSKAPKKKVQLVGAGTILREVKEAAKLLKDDFDIDSDIYSATSFNELRRDGLAVSRYNMLNPEKKPKVSWVESLLAKKSNPVIVASDYMKVCADQLREFIPNTLIVLGTDGFGRSDTRQKLRTFFEVDRYFIVLAALTGLVKDGVLKNSEVKKAIKKYGINENKKNPVDC